MIHKYKLRGRNIVLDVGSGAVHVVDEITYDMLDNVSPPFSEHCPDEVVEKLSRFYQKDDILTCYDEVKQAYEDGILFAPDDYAQYAETNVASPIKAMCLNVAHDCNLRCRYCFASTGDFGGGRALMPLDVGKKAIDFLIAHSANRRNLEVDFFGGEPLLNWDVVKGIVAYAREQEKLHDKNIRFTVTTNGMNLDDEKIDFINREMYNVVLSLDGRKEIHDKMRPRADGSGSYDKVVPLFQKLVAGRGDKEYYIRGTYTRENLDFSDDVFAIYDLGFDQISIEPVVEKPDKPYALTEENLPRIYTEYERLLDRMIESERSGKRVHFFHFMIDLDDGPCVIKRLRGCGCGNEYIAVTPEGDIYPCHQFVGLEEMKMGSVLYGTLDPTMKDDFSRAHIYQKPQCIDCWARLYCSGGCNANNYAFHHDIRRAYKLSCEIEKKRLECAIVLKVERMGEE